MFNTMRKIGLFSITFVVAIVSTGCGADSVQDTLNQERDRQRQMAGTLAKDYQKIVGTYATSFSSANIMNDKSEHYYIIAQINLSYKEKDSSVGVLQPVLVGTFRMFSKEELAATGTKTVSELTTTCDEIGDKDKKKCGYLSTFSGEYDSASKALALHIQGYGVDGIDVSCNQKSEGILDCRWQPASGGANEFNFTIVKSL
jgi:hypothetical protein